MKLSTSLLLSASIATCLTGCASLAPANNPLRSDSPQAQEAKHDTAMAAFKGCGIGAGAGGLIGLLHGGNLVNGIKGAVVGCLAGGVIGGAIEYKHLLDDARKLQAQAQAMGAQATLTTRTIQAKDESGVTKPVQAFDALTIKLDPYKTAHHDQSISNIAVKASTMSDASKTPITIEVDGNQVDRAWLIAVMQPQLTHHTTTIREKFSVTPALVLSPVPDVSSSQAQSNGSN